MLGGCGSAPRALQAEVADNVAKPPKPAASPYDPLPRPAALVLCGDLNVQPQEDEYRQLFEPPLFDAWHAARGAEPHPPSTGLYDRRQWPMGGHCRDYFAVTADGAARVVSVEMDAATDASDHQRCGWCCATDARVAAAAVAARAAKT